MSEVSPDQVAGAMVTIVPVVSEFMWDAKKQVKKAAIKTLSDVCLSIDNIDLEPFFPALTSAITDPEGVEECVHALAATTFVQAVKSSALSITVPVLDRGFKERKVATIRQCAKITENLAKLVMDPADVAPFMPVLLPHLERAKEEVSDPECRTRCAAAYEALKAIGSVASDATSAADEAKAMTVRLDTFPFVLFISPCSTPLTHV